MPAQYHPETTIEVVVEIPRGTRNKYEWDPKARRFRLDRHLFAATVYPADYGFIPDTLAEDGDDLDALVLLEEPTFPGCLVTARPVGLFRMSDEKGPDAKVLAVLSGDPRWEGLQDIDDVPLHLQHEIEHFFQIYKDLEPNKSAAVGGWENRAAALDEIESSRRRAHVEGGADG